MFKAIRLHRKLRIKQSVLCYKVCLCTQTFRDIPDSMRNEFSSINSAVDKIERKIPNIYFILSDIFGGAASMKREVDKICSEYVEKLYIITEINKYYLSKGLPLLKEPE